MTTRREFFQCAGAGLILGLVPLRAAHSATDAVTSDGLIQPFLKIGRDSKVTVISKFLDMGQGTWSGLPSIVAEELDATWAQIAVEGAPANLALYKNLYGFQATGGSISVFNSWDQLRKAGATARALLVQAAAQQWNVPASEIRVVDGMVLHGAKPTLRQASFGELADAAAKLEVPADVPLKNPADYKFLGKTWPRLDSKAKSTGTAVYGIDIQRPGMKIATVARPPLFGATVRSFDASAALKLKGVVDVVQIPTGVAVIADRTWTALSARKLLKIEWDESKAEQRSTAQLLADFKQAGDVASHDKDAIIPGTRRGDVDQAFAQSAQVLEAEFEFPYLAHAPMEPLCAVAEVTGTGAERRCTVWGGLQNQTYDQKAVARILDLPLEQVDLKTLYAGGSFGRRATFNAEWIGELAEIVKATGGRYPIKAVRTREDEITGGYYRTLAVHRIKAGLDASGHLTAWQQTIIAQSFLFPPPTPGVVGKPDPTVLDGTAVERYDVAHAKLDWVYPQTAVPVLFYRALSFNHTSSSKEIMIDDLARLAKRDPLEFRLAHLSGHSRQATVLKLAAEKAGWGRKLKPGYALGLAVQESQQTFTAMVAEVRIVDGAIHVERMVCAVDCGYALNPDIVRSQIEGGIGFDLSAALHSKITLDRGRVEQSNFHDYPVLRINEMPRVEVHIINSGHAPTGVGEPASVLPTAAVANAIRALTGKPVRQLPIRLAE